MDVAVRERLPDAGFCNPDNVMRSFYRLGMALADSKQSPSWRSILICGSTIVVLAVLTIDDNIIESTPRFRNRIQPSKRQSSLFPSPTTDTLSLFCLSGL